MPGSDLSCSSLTGVASSVVFCCFKVQYVVHLEMFRLLWKTSFVMTSLASDINKAFSSTQLWLPGYFLFFRPLSPPTLKMAIVGNPSRSAVSEILGPGHLAPTTMPYSESLNYCICFTVHLSG